MTQFTYKAFDKDSNERQGTIDAVNLDVAIGALQRRGLIISSIDAADKKNIFEEHFAIFDRINTRDVVMVSRQMTTLFEAQVSALRAFRLLATEARTPKLGDKLTEIANDIQSGTTISSALSKHPDMFSNFYVNMVRAGEESGKLDETFSFLADYLDRNYEITQKARNALIYPIFITATFFVVMILMLTFVVPKLSTILSETGAQLPLYTRVILALSAFLTKYILLFILLIGVGGFLLFRYAHTKAGMEAFSRFRLQIPTLGEVYKKLYLSRISDNLATMLKSGIQMLRAIEITSTVVGDVVYEKVLSDVAADVKGGTPASEAFRKHPEVPGIVVAMIKIGEETGNLSQILDTLARFYRREVNSTLDTLVGLIEPFMIVVLAVGVAFLLAAVLMPIYNIASSL